jgi:hypothetical protein
VKRDEAGINLLYEKVKKARKYLNELEASLNPVMLAIHDSEVNAIIVESVNI